LLSGCAGVGKDLESPHIYLADIRLQEVKVFESIFSLELRIVNPNDISLQVKGLNCELEVNDRKFASGASNVKTEIPAYGTTILPIIVYSSSVDIVRSLLELNQEEDLRYRIVGNVHLDGGLSIPSKIPFVREGEFSLDKVAPGSSGQ
jgi:LEA14-like dessication related protein